MKWFYNLKISAKLLSAFITLALITAVVGFVGLSNMNTINTMLNDLYTRHMVGLSNNKEANINLIYYDRAVRNYILAKDQADRDVRLRDMKKYEGRIRDLMEKTKETLLTDEGKEAYKKIMESFEDYLKEVGVLINMVNASGFSNVSDAVHKETVDTRAKANIVDDQMTLLSNLKEKRGKQAYDESDVIYYDSRIFLIILMAGSILSGLGLGIFISRMISNSLIRGVGFAKAVSDGDLTQKIDIDQKDEIGQLANAMNTMVEKMREVVADVKTASDNVASGSQQMSSSSEQLSQGATEQAASAEEASSS
ncbi:MAG: MCP four helix bundle domain-containing protein, partial [Bacillota bacterium]